MPLGMHNTFFDRAPYHLLPRRSHSYFRDDAGIREARFDFDTGITVSNGGLNAPFDDMAKYLAFLLGDGPPDVVLKRSSLEEMWTRQIRAAEGEGVNGTDSYAGLSFFIERYGDVELVGHSGDQNGFISHLYLYRPSRTAYLVSFNTDTTPSKDGSRPGTRQADAAVRDLVIRNILR
jgi:CubicO group peptidase (beta-lactamase class C family)